MTWFHLVWCSGLYQCIMTTGETGNKPDCQLSVALNKINSSNPPDPTRSRVLRTSLIQHRRATRLLIACAKYPHRSCTKLPFRAQPALAHFHGGEPLCDMSCSRRASQRLHPLLPHLQQRTHVLVPSLLGLVRGVRLVDPAGRKYWKMETEVKTSHSTVHLDDVGVNAATEITTDGLSPSKLHPATSHTAAFERSIHPIPRPEHPSIEQLNHHYVNRPDKCKATTARRNVNLAGPQIRVKMIIVYSKQNGNSNRKITTMPSLQIPFSFTQ